MAVTVCGTDHHVGTFYSILKVFCPALHMTVMIFKDAAPVFNHPAVEGLYPADPAHQQYAFAAKVERRAALITTVLRRIVCNIFFEFNCDAVIKRSLFFKP